MRLDTTELQKDSIAVLIHVWPESDEKEQLLDESKADPNAKWDRAEAFVLGMLAITFVEARMWMWKFVLSYPEEKEFIEGFRRTIDDGLNCLMENKALKLVLGVILSLGNILNGGGMRGQADGFNIETISRIGNLSDKNKRSALCYVVDKIREQDPDLAIKKEFELAYKAQRMNIADLGNKVKALTDGFAGFKSRNDTITRSMSEPDSFLKASNKFIIETESDIDGVNERYNDIKEKHKKLCNLYCISPEDEKAKNTEELFGFFTKFFDQLHKIMGEKKKEKRMPEVKKTAVKAPEPPKKGEAKNETTVIPQKATDVSSALSRLKMAHGKRD
eukprot:TRINITY_DN1346_c0_g4_i2.p1 TRINITY_DN1346_c0_g4~~TRINITY_DN1346_c0_g4_i2.p1  ORF type:complete len:332 (-),score=110.87 TRINITY_DN1346_c0_g4_i2:123-1118(-)